MEFSIFSSVHTVEDRAACIEALEKYVGTAYSSKKPENLDQRTEHFFSQFEQLTAEAEDRKKIISDLRDELLRAEVVRMTLAIPPDAELLSRISNEMRKDKSHAHALIEVTVEETMIAGMVLSEGGKIQDFSLRKKMETIDLPGLVAKHIPSLGLS
jgi:RNA binding exosome subunit